MENDSTSRVCVILTQDDDAVAMEVENLQRESQLSLREVMQTIPAAYIAENASSGNFVENGLTSESEDEDGDEGDEEMQTSTQDTVEQSTDGNFQNLQIFDELFFVFIKLRCTLIGVPRGIVWLIVCVT